MWALKGEEKMEEKSLEELELEYEKFAPSVGLRKDVLISNNREFVKRNMPRQDGLADRSPKNKKLSKKYREIKKSKREFEELCNAKNFDNVDGRGM
ncbi:MAG: hypothetical protein ACI4R8_04430 [Candidatus Caccovivens sp.]